MISPRYHLTQPPFTRRGRSSAGPLASAGAENHPPDPKTALHPPHSPMPRRPLAPAALFLLAACATSPTAPSPDAPPASPGLAYTVRIADPTAARVEVDLRITGRSPGAGPLTVALPTRFAFVELAAPLLEGMPAAHDGAGRALPVTELSPFRWTVAAAGADEVLLQLAVPLTHRELPAVRERDAYEFPYLAADHGMLVAGAMLLVPEGFAGRADVRFDLPPGWAVHCPWPRTVAGEYTPDSRGALQNDLFAVGRWEEQVIDANGCEVTVVVAPGQGDLLEQVGSPIERVVHAEIELFGRVPREKYLFLFGRPDPPPAPGERGLSLAGSPKDGSMTLMVRGVGRGIDPARHIGHLIAHEFHHTWAHPNLALPDELRFVGEGFTDYYAYLVLAREGMIPWEEFAEVMRKKARDYAANADRGTLSLTEAGGPPFFEGGAAYSLVYDGGTLFAAMVDRRIRAQGDGRSLDEMMRAFFNDPRWHRGETPPTLDDFFACLGAFLPAEEVALLAAQAMAREGFDATEATLDPTAWSEHTATDRDS